MTQSKISVFHVYTFFFSWPGPSWSKVDSTIHLINPYPLDNGYITVSLNTYQLPNSDLSGGGLYKGFEQPGSDG